MGELNKRLNLLTENEIQMLYGFPKFTNEERQYYFQLNSFELFELDYLQSLQTKVHFILQLGYFKAKRMFFSFSENISKQIEEDIEHVVKRYYSNEDFSKVTKNLPKQTRVNLQNKLLKLLNYRICTQEIKIKLEEKASRVAIIHAKPIYIFNELINYLESYQTIIPGYSFMQDIVGRAIEKEKKRLEIEIKKNIPKNIKASLKALFMARSPLYKLTLMKKEPKNFNYKQITEEVQRQHTLKPLYDFAVDFLPKLSISNENIKHYASLVEYYTPYKLKRKKEEMVYLYLLCFIFHRYCKISDNLINGFIYHVNNYISEAKQVAKEEVYNLKIESNDRLKDVAKILSLFIDEEIPSVEIKEKAFSILEKDKFSLLCKYLSKIQFDEMEYQWNYYDKASLAFKKNLRPIFMSIDFASPGKEDPLLHSVELLKKAFSENKSLSHIKNLAIPQMIIPFKWKKYLYEEGIKKENNKVKKYRELNVNKYEFLIYRLLKEGLESFDIFVKDSINFKSFEEDLVDDETWKNEKTLIKSLALPYLHKPIEEILTSLKDELETKLKQVNKRIKRRENKHIKITQKKDKTKWHLPYPKSKKAENHPFYEHLGQIEIHNLVNFVDEQTDFLDAFTHIVDKYKKSEMDKLALKACIIAFATNMGIIKMANISDSSYQTLFVTNNNFIRLETLKAANDMVSNAFAKLPIFTEYNLEEDTIHASSDGQKFETRISTINSRHSPKYFGLKKGIVDYSLVANHVPINAKIIGANEHESHYVFDLIYNNTSDIDPNAISVDAHGKNNVNAGILHVFGKLFANRFVKFNQDSKIIYAFKPPSSYKNYLIKPVRKINTNLIEEEWPNIKRIMVSLGVKRTTQSAIVRKLSSSKRKNKTKRALWEYDNIVSSIYALDYIDNPILRQSVQKSINRGESYHRLKRAIFHDNLGKFKVKTQLEQEIWSQCTRLIANCIIFYNAYILSNLMEIKGKDGKHAEANLIKKISPIAWRHVNLNGKFEFYGEKITSNVEKTVESLRKIYFGMLEIDE